MPFRRFFERRPDDRTPDPDAAAHDLTAADDESDPGEDVEELPPEHADAIDWAARARAVIVGGASTGSKRPAVLYGDAGTGGPSHFVRAVGCRVWDTDETPYIDCTMALGAVALGYAEPTVVRGVADAAAGGNVSALSDWREVEVAERLCAVIPCAERVQFMKTGAEAVAAAVRIARAHTGREHVIGSGYFGWGDWSSDAAGVPAGTRGAFTSVPFDDIDALDAAARAAGDRLAAIVLEPVVERLPSEAWIGRAREICDARGAVLVFDEIKTGFRIATGGYQEYAGVVPDLATFGKAMANGYPLSAVVGSAAVMAAADRTWISSTLASEATALAAALAVLDWHEQADIAESLWSIGADMRKSMDDAIAASGVGGVTVEGIDPMWMLRFDDPVRETRFLEFAIAEGVLFKRGAYNYPAIAHDEDTLRAIESAASGAFVALREADAG